MSIQGYYSALQSHLATAFAGRIETVGDYNATSDGKINTPALLIDIEFMPLGEDMGDDRLPLRLNVVVHCILSLRTPNVQREVRALAAEVMQTLRYFSINTTPLVAHMPQSLSAGVGVWRAGQHGYESQEVSFEQEVRLGDSAWSGEGTLPGEVYLGIDPDIGIPHEPDYERVVPGE